MCICLSQQRAFARIYTSLTHTAEFNTKQNEYLTKKKTMWRRRKKTILSQWEKKGILNWSNLKYPEIDFPYNVYANIIKLKFLEGVVDEFFFCMPYSTIYEFALNSRFFENESNRCIQTYIQIWRWYVHWWLKKYSSNIDSVRCGCDEPLHYT